MRRVVNHSNKAKSFSRKNDITSGKLRSAKSSLKQTFAIHQSLPASSVAKLIKLGSKITDAKNHAYGSVNIHTYIHSYNS